MFRLPCLLDPQVAPTAAALAPQGSRAVYTTLWTGGYPQELWYRYVPESGNWHGGTHTRWIVALSAATEKHSRCLTADEESADALAWRPRGYLPASHTP